MINGAAELLEQEIAGATRANESRLPGYEAIYVHFHDARIPQQLAVWLYATTAGAPYNVRGYPDVIGVGLKHDADQELVRGEWKLRPLAPFTWRTHVDDRWEGYRWLRRAGELPDDPGPAADELGERVLRTLRRSSAL
ncbi:MAG: hypothetical protein QOJ35_2985 [Solirubrobacteraceae bacterium]|nr:hypothetical protein [Solirubrobacteraceae bacterium]